MKRFLSMVLLVGLISLPFSSCDELEDEEDLKHQCTTCGGFGTCYVCSGTGKCPVCYGVKYEGAPCTYCHDSGKCPDCKGKGKCPDCKGKGWTTSLF